MSLPPVWLRGAVPGYPPQLVPVAHALLQAREDLASVTTGVSTDDLWVRSGAAAPAGFHLRHLAGSLDRLLTYARGEELSDVQVRALMQEKTSEGTLEALLRTAQQTIDRALEQIRLTPPDSLFEPRAVGRARLPSTVLGLLVHAAEHTARHVGQVTTTLKAVSRRAQEA